LVGSNSAKRQIELRLKDDFLAGRVDVLNLQEIKSGTSKTRPEQLIVLHQSVTRVKLTELWKSCRYLFSAPSTEVASSRIAVVVSDLDYHSLEESTRPEVSAAGPIIPSPYLRIRLQQCLVVSAGHRLFELDIQEGSLQQFRRGPRFGGHSQVKVNHLLIDKLLNNSALTEPQVVAALYGHLGDLETAKTFKGLYERVYLKADGTVRRKYARARDVLSALSVASDMDGILNAVMQIPETHVKVVPGLFPISTKRSGVRAGETQQIAGLAAYIGKNGHATRGEIGQIWRSLRTHDKSSWREDMGLLCDLASRTDSQELFVSLATQPVSLSWDHLVIPYPTRRIDPQDRRFVPCDGKMYLNPIKLGALVADCAPEPFVKDKFLKELTETRRRP
jgi:hypothetical protein